MWELDMMITEKNYQENFGETIKTFLHKNDLFIILDTNFSNWNISDDQLKLVDKVLSKKSNNFKNVFIFTHQIIWFNHHGFSRASVNSFEGLDGEQTNYWSIFEPLLKKYNYYYILLAILVREIIIEKYFVKNLMI